MEAAKQETGKQAVVEGEEQGKEEVKKEAKRKKKKQAGKNAGKELRDRSTRFARIYFHFQLLKCVTESMFAYVCECV